MVSHRARVIRLRTAVPLAALLVAAAGCQSRPSEQSGVKLVEATIDGLTCETCVPPLSASLKRQFDKSEIQVDDEHDTATVKFDAKQEFSEAAFRDAVTQVSMRVLSFRLQACGRVEAKGSERWLVAGGHRFLVRSNQDLPLDQPLCLDGMLSTGSGTSTLEVSKFERQPLTP